MDVSGQLHASAALSSGKHPLPGTHWRGSWVGHRACLDVMAKRNISLFRFGTEPRPSSPHSSRYTDWAIQI